MTPDHDDSPAVIETRIVHETHRRATSMLADAVTGPPAGPDRVVELRDFVVATLEHHHRAEDTDLWPRLRAAAPELGDALDGLTLEHDRLDGALEQLRSAAVGERDDAGAVAAARGVRDLVHEHLAREEPLLFPALRSHLSEAEWADFSRRTVDSAPRTGIHLMVGLLHEVGAADEVELILRHLPDEARRVVPAMREQARAIFADLRSPVDTAR
jgi:hemerythrin-like domain-containing protein